MNEEPKPFDLVRLGLHGIPWVRFTRVEDHRLTPHDLCLWWVPIRGSPEVFTGRVAYWQAARQAVVARAHGSMVIVGPGAFFALITPPFNPPCTQLDDAIPVSGSTASAAPPCAPRGVLQVGPPAPPDGLEPHPPEPA